MKISFLIARRVLRSGASLQGAAKSLNGSPAEATFTVLAGFDTIVAAFFRNCFVSAKKKKSKVGFSKTRVTTIQLRRISRAHRFSRCSISRMGDRFLDRYQAFPTIDHYLKVHHTLSRRQHGGLDGPRHLHGPSHLGGILRELVRVWKSLSAGKKTPTDPTALIRHTAIDLTCSQ